MQKNILRIIALLALGVLLACSVFSSGNSIGVANAQSSCPSSDVLRITMYPLPDSFNWLTTGVLSGFYTSGLQWYNAYPFPVLPGGGLDWNESVTNWVTANSNYTQWTFHTTPNLKWSDGSNVTAQDILTTYGANYGLNATYDYAGLGSEISKSYAVNQSTAVFELNQSDAHFPERMGSMLYITVMPPQITNQGPGSNNFGTDVAVGPFYVSNYTSGSPEMIMQRNPYFHPLPTACQVDVNFAESNTQAVQSLVSGQSDLVGPLDPANVPAVIAGSNNHLIDEKGQFITTLQYNITSYPYNMTQFRQALAYGINFSTIQQQGFGGYAVPGSRSEGTVPSSVFTYNPNIAQYSYNVSKALDLLKSIGITKGSDGSLHYPNGTALSTTIWTDNEKTYDAVVAGLVQTDLQNLGIKTSLQVVTPGDISADYGSNLYGIRDSLIVWTSEGPTFTDAWLDAQPGWNVYLRPGVSNSHWEYPPSADAEFQGNLTAIDTSANASVDTTALNDIQLLNAQYLPIIVLAYPDNIYAYNTQRWTGWPALYENGNWWNTTALAALQLTSSATSTSTSTSATGTTFTTSSTGTGTVTSSSSSTAVSTTTSSSSSSALTYEIAAVVVVIVIVAIAGALFARRRGTH